MKKLKKIKKEFLATCPLGLEQLLVQELEELKISVKKVHFGSVLFGSSDKDFIKVILFSRIASKVFKKMYEFELLNEKQLYQECLHIKWKSLLSVDQTFKVDCKISKGLTHRFKNSMYLSLVVKDALVDSFRNDVGKRPSIDKDNPDVPLFLEVFGKKSEATAALYLDLTSVPVSRRGYRQVKTTAPLQENLAAGIIKIVRPTSTQLGFVDYMCGSGTLLSEFILNQFNIPPSFLNIEYEFRFQRMTFFKKDKYLMDTFEKGKRKVTQLANEGLEKYHRSQLFLLGNDVDPECVEATRVNLESMGLKIPPLSTGCFTKLNFKGKKVTTLVNLPYGERIHPEEGISKLQSNLLGYLAKYGKGQEHFYFCANDAVSKKLLNASEKITTLRNGAINCHLSKINL